jgi:ribosomal protein S27AE
MSEISKMNCPSCGAPMNHHCDKLVYGASQPDSPELPDDGGVVLEFHSCPGCGRSATRNI